MTLGVSKTILPKTHLYKENPWELPGGPMVTNPTSTEGVWVRPLVGELKSYMPCGAGPRKRRKTLRFREGAVCVLPPLLGGF